MADRTRTVTLRVKDEFSRQLLEYARQMQGAERATQEFSRSTSGAGGFQQLNQSLFYMAQNANMVYGAFKQVFSTANQWAQVGIQAQRSEKALTALSGSAQNAEKWIDAIQRASRYTVTEGEAAAQAYQLMRFNLADTAEEAERFVKTISIVAGANPALGGTSEAINQIQLTMSNMSFMRLDQLGISAGVVRKRMAELQSQIKGLGKEEAFQMAVTEQLEEQASILGDSFLKTGTATEQLKTKLRELKEVIGVEVAEGFDGAATAALSFSTIWDSLKDDPVRTLTVIVEQTWSEVKGKPGDVNINPFNPTEGDYYGWSYDEVMGNTWNQQSGGWNAFFQPMQRAARVNELYQQLYESERGSYGGATNYSQWTPAMSAGYLGRPETSQQAWDTIQSIPGGLNQQILGGPGNVGTAWRGRQAFRGMASGAQEMGAEALTRADAAARSLVSTLTGAVGAVGGMAAGAERAAAAMDAANASMDQFARVGPENLADKFGIDPDSFDVDVFNRMREALGEAGVETEAAADAMQQYQLMTGMATGQSEVFAGQMDTLAEKLAEGSISLDDYVRGVQALGQADYSWVDTLVGGMVDQGNVAGAQSYIEMLAGMTPQGMQATGQGIEAMQGLDSFLRGLMPAGGDAEGLLGAKFIDGIGDAQSQVDEFKAQMQELDGTRYRIGLDVDVSAPSSITIPLNMSLPSRGQDSANWSSDAAPMGRDMPEFAEGGWTGDGTQPFLARLHPRELVLNERMWTQLLSNPQRTQSRGRGDVTINAVLNEASDAQGIMQQIQEILRRQGSDAQLLFKRGEGYIAVHRGD